MGLGRGLGLPVLAEGVEILGELKFLDAEACEIGQGDYLGRPSPLETFGELTGVTAPVIQDEDARHRSGSILMLEPAAALRST